MQYSYWQIFICRICQRNFKDFPYFQNGHYSNCTFQSGTIHLNIVVAFSKSLLFQHFSSPLLHLYTVFSKKITNVPLLSINECKVPKADTKNKYLYIPLLFIKCFSLPYKMEKFAMAKDDFDMQKWNFSSSRLFIGTNSMNEQ